MKLKIKQSETQKKLVKSAMLCFFSVFLAYIGVYIAVISTGIQTNKQLATVKKINLDLAKSSNQYAKMHDDLYIAKASNSGFIKITDSHFAVRKSAVSSLSIVYEGR